MCTSAWWNPQCHNLFAWPLRTEVNHHWRGAPAERRTWCCHRDSCGAFLALPGVNVSYEAITKNLVICRDYTNQLYRIMISRYKDTCKPTSIMECHKRFGRCSGVVKRIQKTKRLFNLLNWEVSLTFGLVTLVEDFPVYPDQWKDILILPCRRELFLTTDRSREYELVVQRCLC